MLIYFAKLKDNLEHLEYYDYSAYKGIVKDKAYIAYGLDMTGMPNHFNLINSRGIDKMVRKNDFDIWCKEIDEFIS